MLERTKLYRISLNFHVIHGFHQFASSVRMSDHTLHFISSFISGWLAQIYSLLVSWTFPSIPYEYCDAYTLPLLCNSYSYFILSNSIHTLGYMFPVVYILPNSFTCRPFTSHMCEWIVNGLYHCQPLPSQFRFPTCSISSTRFESVWDFFGNVILEEGGQS